MLILLALACHPPQGPAPSGSPSALLASQVAEVGRRSALLSAHSHAIDGAMDAWRAASPAERPAIEAQIRDAALGLQAEAAALQADVQDIEEQARAWDP